MKVTTMVAVIAVSVCAAVGFTVWWTDSAWPVFLVLPLMLYQVTDKSSKP